MIRVPEETLGALNFRAVYRRQATLEEVLDHLEEEGDGPLHLEGEGVAIKPDSDDEESLEEVLDEESKVGSNACRALQ